MCCGCRILDRFLASTHESDGNGNLNNGGTCHEIEALVLTDCNGTQNSRGQGGGRNSSVGGCVVHDTVRLEDKGGRSASLNEAADQTSKVKFAASNCSPEKTTHPDETSF
jgi:hypothetical protein